MADSKVRTTILTTRCTLTHGLGAGLLIMYSRYASKNHDTMGTHGTTRQRNRVAPLRKGLVDVTLAARRRCT